MFPSVATAGSPPNPNDPCARNGRDTCGTTGVGFYRRYRYGLRWFGDYRGAVRGETHSFCIDLGYWYASRRYRYRLLRAAPLRNRAGELVSREHLRELAYAVWRYGRRGTRVRQAAVMLFVHSRMGDARPGELDPKALGPAVVTAYRQIVRNAHRDHGPYRIEMQLPGPLVVDEPTTASVRVLSAQGFALPHVGIDVAGHGIRGGPAHLETNATGVARLAVTPTTTRGLRLRLVSQPLAAAQPRVFVPTAGAAATSGQRLAVPAADAVSATIIRSDVHAAPRLTTHVRRRLVRRGARVTDTISVRGLGGADAAIEVDLFGPFDSRSKIRCSGRPFWRAVMLAHGDSTITTSPVRLTRAGFYTYSERVLASGPVGAAATTCALAPETTLSAPRIVTGRGDTASPTPASVADGDTPTRLRIPALEIDAAVVPNAIDTTHGVLGVPADIHRIAWWRDGSAPGATHGVVLLAGHRDSARAGIGALFALDHARTGQLVRLTTRSGRTHLYRITAVRHYRKDKLPLGVYAQSGRPRLVLVTCGGPFDARTGHYRDNIVVTARPGS